MFIKPTKCFAKAFIITRCVLLLLITTHSDYINPFLGTFTVQFYDGVIRCLKRMHIKSMPEDAKGQVRILEISLRFIYGVVCGFCFCLFVFLSREIVTMSSHTTSFRLQSSF